MSPNVTEAADRIRELEAALQATARALAHAPDPITALVNILGVAPALDLVGRLRQGGSVPPDAAAYIEDLEARIEALKARIEALEAALQKIMHDCNGHSLAVRIARDALAASSPEGK